MDWVVFFGFDWPALVNGVAGDVEHAAHDSFTDWHRYGFAGIGDLQPAFQAFGAGHRNRPDTIVPKLLLHFERQFHGSFVHLKINGQCIVDARDSILEFHVYHGTNHLNDFAFIHIAFISVRNLATTQPPPSWPPTIS